MNDRILAQPAGNGKIQTAPPYHCPTCGAPIREVLQYSHFISPTALRKPLDDLAEHLHYLNCHTCGKCQRVARVGDAVLPFDWPRDVTPEEEARVLARLVKHLVVEAGPQQDGGDPAASIVWRLLAGTLAPLAAIGEIHALVEVAR